MTFKEWLLSKGYSINTINSIISRINRIKDEYHIEYEFDRDRCTSLINDFTYTAKDFKNGICPKVCIEIDGDYIIGLNSLRQALKLYVDYLALNTVQTVEVCYTPSDKFECIIECGLSEFNRYTGPSWRNKIQTITKTLKNKVSTCECCGSKTELHAAHKRGFERVDIIKDILIRDFKIADDRFRVDLKQFEQKFIDAHKPFDQMFYFLCQDCHKIYDSDDNDARDSIIKAVNNNRKVIKQTYEKY